ncbi:hypothetical protein VNO77_23040 [Canavalia gladiata]|uniref:Uncharacterized protein n=1 Tax=Canavalia gladiata TaxID=3824 RepID=A0AAN9L3S3_CANGL
MRGGVVCISWSAGCHGLCGHSIAAPTGTASRTISECQLSPSTTPNPSYILCFWFTEGVGIMTIQDETASVQSLMCFSILAEMEFLPKWIASYIYGSVKVQDELGDD